MLTFLCLWSHTMRNCQGFFLFSATLIWKPAPSWSTIWNKGHPLGLGPNGIGWTRPLGFRKSNTQQRKIRIGSRGTLATKLKTASPNADTLSTKYAATVQHSTTEADKRSHLACATQSRIGLADSCGKPCRSAWQRTRSRFESGSTDSMQH